MAIERPIRTGLIALILLGATGWALALNAASPTSYPNGQLLVSAAWLQQHQEDPGLVIVDVRTDEHYHGEAIDGAIRMPWSQFRTTDPVAGVTGVFIGAQAAQELLGAHGINRDDTVVLYDSVERDGGATASYVFWVMELLGHQDVKVLDGGIDAWKRAGLPTTDQPVEREPVVYQAMPETLKRTARIDSGDLHDRLGDAYYQVLDVRSRSEYLGETPNADWQGAALKLGHIPGAYNVNYQHNWVDTEQKLVKPYGQLQRMYPGLNPDRAVVVYCHSARRGSYGYFVLRLMGFEDVRLYDGSWMHWGKKDAFFPVQTRENVLSGALPGTTGTPGDQPRSTQQQTSRNTDASSAGGGSGYISCGG